MGGKPCAQNLWVISMGSFLKCSRFDAFMSPLPGRAIARKWGGYNIYVLVFQQVEKYMLWGFCTETPKEMDSPKTNTILGRMFTNGLIVAFFL